MSISSETERLTAEVSLWRVTIYGLFIGFVFNMLLGVFFNGFPQWITITSLGSELFHLPQYIGGVILWTIVFCILIFILEYKKHLSLSFLDRTLVYVAGINMAFIISLVLVLVPTSTLQTVVAKLYGMPFIWLVEPIPKDNLFPYFVWAGYTYSLLFWIFIISLIIFLVKRKEKVINRLRAITAETKPTS